jgi:hypothetical protein
MTEAGRQSHASVSESPRAPAAMPACGRIEHVELPTSSAWGEGVDALALPRGLLWRDLSRRQWHRVDFHR